MVGRVSPLTSIMYLVLRIITTGCIGYIWAYLLGLQMFRYVPGVTPGLPNKAKCTGVSMLIVYFYGMLPSLILNKTIAEVGYAMSFVLVFIFGVRAAFTDEDEYVKFDENEIFDGTTTNMSSYCGVAWMMSGTIGLVGIYAWWVSLGFFFKPGRLPYLYRSAKRCARELFPSAIDYYLNMNPTPHFTEEDHATSDADHATSGVDREVSGDSATPG